jgi:hypothetical protein
MGGLFYTLAILGVCVAIHWYATNDSANPNSPTKGLLAMRDPATIKNRAAKKRTLAPFRRHKQ